MKKIILMAMVFCVTCPIFSFAEKQHDMAGIQFKTPNGWTSSVKRYTITISKNGENELLMVTNMPYKGNLPDLSEVKGDLKQMGNKLLKNAVEKDLMLREFNRGQVKGYYFTLTDKAPKPGEFEYMTEGAVISGRIFIIFTALSKGKRDPSEEALAMIASIKSSK